MKSESYKKPEIRVSAGLYKGKRILPPNIEGFRSVLDKAKQAVFAIIEPANIDSATCLDLFAGSGIMGIEALSRNASFVDFVDSTYEAFSTIQTNLAAVGANEFLYETHLIDAAKFVVKYKGQKKYNFIFCDPFYADIKQRYLVENITGIMAKTGLFIYFHSPDFDPTTLIVGSGLKEYTKRQFGNSCFTIFSRQ
jgi:16S rRNA (guanine966-N2)-methyltransferase